MALFPFFMDISGKEGLIVGGGKHALEKVQRLALFSPCLKVIASGICPEIESLAEESVKGHPEMAEKEYIEQALVRRITLIRRDFCESDLDSLPAFVIVAGDDPEENHRISELCRERRIPVNVVDDQAYCDFVFPSLIARGDLSVGICTNGASPGTGVLLKRKMEQQIPDHIEEILDYLKGKRPEITARVTERKKRFSLYYALSEMCMELDRPLTEPEFEELIGQKER